MMDEIDGRRFKRIDPLSHRTTTRERIGRAFLWLGGVMVFLLVSASVVAAAIVYWSGMVS